MITNFISKSEIDRAIDLWKISGVIFV